MKANNTNYFYKENLIKIKRHQGPFSNRLLECARLDYTVCSGLRRRISQLSERYSVILWFTCTPSALMSTFEMETLLFIRIHRKEDKDSNSGGMFLFFYLILSLVMHCGKNTDELYKDNITCSWTAPDNFLVKIINIFIATHAEKKPPPHVSNRPEWLTSFSVRCSRTVCN